MRLFHRHRWRYVGRRRADLAELWRDEWRCTGCPARRLEPVYPLRDLEAERSAATYRLRDRG